MLVADIVARIRAEDIARQGFSTAGYCNLHPVEGVLLDQQEERARHSWKFRADCKRIAGYPFVWVNTLTNEVIWNGARGGFRYVGFTR